MQSRLISAIEASANTLIGYILSVVVGQMIVYPAFGYHITLAHNAAMTAIFVAVSLLRSYTLRRVFSRWMNGVLTRWTMRLSKQWRNFRQKTND